MSTELLLLPVVMASVWFPHCTLVSSMVFVRDTGFNPLFTGMGKNPLSRAPSDSRNSNLVLAQTFLSLA